LCILCSITEGEHRLQIHHDTSVLDCGVLLTLESFS